MNQETLANRVRAHNALRAHQEASRGAVVEVADGLSITGYSSPDVTRPGSIRMIKDETGEDVVRGYGSNVDEAIEDVKRRSTVVKQRQQIADSAASVNEEKMNNAPQTAAEQIKAQWAEMDDPESLPKPGEKSAEQKAAEKAAEADRKAAEKAAKNQEGGN